MLKNLTFYTLLPYLSFALLVIIAGLYAANLLFGANGLSRLQELSARKSAIAADVERLMHQNAALQKELFELKGLEPK